LAVCGVCLACLTVVSKLYRYLGNSSHAGAVWQLVSAGGGWVGTTREGGFTTWDSGLASIIEARVYGAPVFFLLCHICKARLLVLFCIYINQVTKMIC
jgi:hypothetical protein